MEGFRLNDDLKITHQITEQCQIGNISLPYPVENNQTGQNNQTDQDKNIGNNTIKIESEKTDNEIKDEETEDNETEDDETQDEETDNEETEDEETEDEETEDDLTENDLTANDLTENNKLDCSDLRQYYKNLSQELIKEDIQLMKIADLRELYQLIASNCKHYVSIIENYKEENLQTLFNMIVRRIEGHLLIKFKLNMDERWVEVGFFDNDNTDKETMSELKTSIEFYLKNSDQIEKNRRKHLVAQFDNQNQEKSTVKDQPKKKALPDDYFNPKNNPELAVSRKQLESAGYRALPSSLKEKEKSLREFENQPMDLTNYLGNENPQTNSVKSQIKDENHLIDDALTSFKKEISNTLKKKFNHQNKNECNINKNQNTDICSLIDNRQILNQYSQNINVIESIYESLQTAPFETHAILYGKLFDFLNEQSDAEKAACYLGLLQQKSKKQINKNQSIDKNQLLNCLTENQRKIIDQYNINIMELFN